MSSIKLFENRQVRSQWDEDRQAWYFSVVDVVGVFTASPNPRKYWSVLKTRLKNEGSELATNCSQLKMQSADGKNYLMELVLNMLAEATATEISRQKNPIKRFLPMGAFCPPSVSSVCAGGIAQ